MGGSDHKPEDLAKRPAPDVSGPTGIPGKSTLVQQGRPATSAAAIGDVWIENREAKGGQGNFLTDVQRDRLVTEIKISIRQSETFFVQALTEIGFARLIEKDEEIPAIVALALDIASGYLGGLAVKAVKALRSAPPEKFHKTVESMLDFQTSTDDAKDPSLVRNLLNIASEESLTDVVKRTMAAGKKKAEGNAKADQSADASDRKQVTLSYLDELKKSAAISYQHLARELPGVANDAERIAAYKAFDAENGHNEPDLKAVLELKLARYLKSPASEIGRNKHRLKDGASKKDSYNATVRDTEVAWVVIAGDPVPKLYYMRQDWANNGGSADGIPDPSYLDGTPNERGVPDHAAKSQQGMLTLSTPVEPEFQSTALARQQQVWRRPPTTRHRTREELAAETGDYSLLAIPRLDLSPAHRKLPPPGPVQGPKPLPPLGPVQGPRQDPDLVTPPVSVIPNLIPGGTT